MKQLTKILLPFAAVFFIIGCTPELKIPLETIDVEFIIQDAITLEPGTKTLSFEVKDGKAPQPDDLLILNGPRGQYYCKIVSTDNDSFTIELYDNFANGEHEISIQRGLSTKFAGLSTIIVEKYDDGVKAAEGSTVYGKVSCAGEPLEGVVVSDGVEVVKTDENGVYQMKSGKANGYVFVSLPRGYQAPLNVVVPQIWVPLVLAKNDTERADFELVKAKDQTHFKLIVFGDIHLARRLKDRSQFKHCLDDVNQYRQAHSGEAIYGLTLGDMTWDQFWVDNSYSFPEYIQEMKPLEGMPIYQTPGNHDHDEAYAGDILTIRQYRKYLGPSFYSYNIGGVHLISLDNMKCTNDGKGSRTNDPILVPEVIEWLKKDLATVTDKSTPIFISMHRPLYRSSFEKTTTVQKQDSESNYHELINAVKDFKTVHLFTAHTHKVYHVKKDNIFEHNAGAVCATWWWTGYRHPGINVCRTGAVGGYTIVEVNGKEVKYQYKGTKIDLSKQFYTYDRNTINLSASKYIPEASKTCTNEWKKITENWNFESRANEVYIEVWNWDPWTHDNGKKWKVEVFENGEALTVTAMQGHSPLHIVTHSAHILDGESIGNFATELGVLHKVTASSKNSTLIIKVTDPYGNVSTETMKRPKEFDLNSYKAYYMPDISKKRRNWHPQGGSFFVFS